MTTVSFTCQKPRRHIQSRVPGVVLQGLRRPLRRPQGVDHRAHCSAQALPRTALRLAGGPETRGPVRARRFFFQAWG